MFYFFRLRSKFAATARCHVSGQAKLCDGCGYDLTRLVNADAAATVPVDPPAAASPPFTIRCPECGQIFDHARADAAWLNALDEHSDRPAEQKDLKRRRSQIVGK